MLQHHNRRTYHTRQPDRFKLAFYTDLVQWHNSTRTENPWNSLMEGTRGLRKRQGGQILPVLEIAKDVEPRILSLVMTDLKTKRITGLKKEAFKELLWTAGIPFQYCCRRSYATWDILLPMVKQAARTAATNIMTKNFHLQPEYMGTLRVRVTICNVPAFLTGEVPASFLSAYGRVANDGYCRPHCWNCKQLGHIVKFCPQKE